MNGAFAFLGNIIFILIGAYLFWDAIRDFKKERYFLFGIGVMMIITVCFHLGMYIFAIWTS